MPASPVRWTPRLIAGLRSPADDDLVPACGPEVIRPVLDVLGAGPLGWAVQLARQGMTRVLADVPEERQAELVPRLAPAIEQTALELLLALCGRGRPFTLNPGEVAINAYLAGEGISFERVVRGLRLVRQEWTVALLDQAEAHVPAEERGPVLRDLTDVVNEFFDQTMDAVIADYMHQRQRLLARRLADQRTMIDSIVAGDQVSASAVRDVLGTDLTGHHLGLVLWREDSRSVADPQGDLEHTAHKAAAALDSPALLTIAADRSTLWAWATSAAPIDAGALPRAQLAGPTGIRIAVGRCAPGPAGFRRTHLAALDARRAAQPGKRTGSITVYDDVALFALMSTDSERARWFVHDELGPLAAPDRAGADLRATLLAYLDHGGSLIKAAEALHVHRNTVVYRLRRAEEALGRPVNDRILETHTALRLAPSLFDE